MTDGERAELETLQGFADLLGITEMEDTQFYRYLALLDLQRIEKEAR